MRSAQLIALAARRPVYFERPQLSLQLLSTARRPIAFTAERMSRRLSEVVSCLLTGFIKRNRFREQLRSGRD